MYEGLETLKPAYTSVADPGCSSRIRSFPSPVGSGSASKNLSIFNHKNCYQALVNMVQDDQSRIFPIPDPGVKKHRIPDLDPQHWLACL